MQTRLEIILETVNGILESRRERRRETRAGKVLAHFDFLARGVPEAEIPYLGARTQRSQRPRGKQPSPPTPIPVVDQRGTWDAARGVVVVPATSPRLELG